MQLNYLKKGTGRQLLLIHGLGGSRRSWNSIIDQLSTEREVIAIDLPGFGKTAPLEGEVTMSKLADAVTVFLKDNDLIGIDAVGSSMGARLVIELARRRNILGTVISLDPGGFWKGWERHMFFSSIFVSIRLIRLLQGKIREISYSETGRALLLAQFSDHPKKLPGDIVYTEMKDYISSQSFDNLLKNLAYGEEQKGAEAGSMTKPLIIVWGRNDKVCIPKQAKRALEKFPDATLKWLDNCGHFPHWDQPGKTIRIILEATK